MERSLVLIKPDGIQRGLAGKIISRLERRGLRIVALKMLWMDRELAGRHYAVHKTKPFFSGLVDFITSSPIIAIVFEGIQSCRSRQADHGRYKRCKSSSGNNPGRFRHRFTAKFSTWIRFDGKCS